MLRDLALSRGVSEGEARARSAMYFSLTIDRKYCGQPHQNSPMLHVQGRQLGW